MEVIGKGSVSSSRLPHRDTARDSRNSKVYGLGPREHFCGQLKLSQAWVKTGHSLRFFRRNVLFVFDKTVFIEILATCPRGRFNGLLNHVLCKLAWRTQIHHSLSFGRPPNTGRFLGPERLYQYLTCNSRSQRSGNRQTNCR